jgi:hypothetical protein
MFAIYIYILAMPDKDPPGPLGTAILPPPVVLCNGIKTDMLIKCSVYKKKGKDQYNSYKLTFLTFEAANQTHGCKRNRQVSYRPNKLHHLDQKSKLISRFTFSFILVIYPLFYSLFIL